MLDRDGTAEGFSSHTRRGVLARSLAEAPPRRGRVDRKPSLSELVAAAYYLEGTTDAWLARSVRSWRKHLDGGFGTFGAVVDGTSRAVVHSHLDGADPVNLTLTRLGAAMGLHSRLVDCDTYTSAGRFGGPATRFASQFFSGAAQPRDCLGVAGADRASMSILFGAPRSAIRAPTATELRLGRKAMPHFSAALRLRRSLTDLTFDAESAEAVFDPHGRCVHAQGMAVDRQARELLREAVVRGSKVAGDENDDPAEAILAGRWSLVDRFDHRGERFMVAYRNPPGVVDPRQLSPRERDVAIRIARGMSQRDVARELGIRPSSVASAVGKVVCKLGLRSMWEMPLFWRDARGLPVAVDADNVVALASPPCAHAGHLTNAERDVLDRVVQGLSNQEIARLRRSSVRTVANQMAALFRKIDVFTRLELAVKATGDGTWSRAENVTMDAQENQP